MSSHCWWFRITGNFEATIEVYFRKNVAGDKGVRNHEAMRVAVNLLYIALVDNAITRFEKVSKKTKCLLSLDECEALVDLYRARLNHLGSHLQKLQAAETERRKEEQEKAAEPIGMGYEVAVIKEKAKAENRRRQTQKAVDEAEKQAKQRLGDKRTSQLVKPVMEP